MMEAFRDWLIDRAAHDVPLLMLIVMGAGSVWMLFCASRRPDGFIGKMLQDEAGKPSVLRLMILWGFVYATWALMKDVLRPEGVDTTNFLTYCGMTFGAHVVAKIGERWDGHLPWAKGPTP
jgi:hypothetical protein